MEITSVLVPGSTTIGKLIIDISTDANKRLKWFSYDYLLVGFFPMIDAIFGVEGKKG